MSFLGGVANQLMKLNLSQLLIEPDVAFPIVHCHLSADRDETLPCPVTKKDTKNVWR